MVHERSFESLRALYRDGGLSPVAVTASSLEHAEAVNGRLNAFALIDAERAIGAARASEKRWREGKPLSDIDGMPVAIKDGAALEGWPSRKGSVVTSAAPVNESAAVVTRLIAAGAVLIGKTRMPEDRKSTRLNSSHGGISRMPSSA